MSSTSHTRAVLSRPLAVAYFAILVAVAAAWSNALHGAPVFDDHWLVVDNPCFGGAERFWALLTLSVENRYCTVRPMRYVSYGIDSALFGLSMFSFHLGNVLRHLVAAVLAGALATLAARRLCASALQREHAPWVGVAVAMLWSLHPVQTDSVSYVSGRRDILAGLFTFVSVGAGVVAFSAHGGRRLRARVLAGVVAAVALVAGVLSKENAAAVPALLGAWLVLERENSESGRRYPLRLRTLVAMALAAACSAVVLWRLLPMSITNRAMDDFWGGSLSSHVGTIAWLQLRYVLQWIGAVPLIGDYHASTITLPSSVFAPRALLGFAWLVVAAMTAWRLRTTAPLVSLGIIWWIFALAPTSQLIPHHELYAEHYLYTALWGLSLVVAAGVSHVVLGVPRDGVLPLRPSLVTLGVAVALAQIFVIADRNRLWRDEQTFYESVWAQAPENERAMGNLIFIYAGRGEWHKALAPCGRMMDRWEPGTSTQRDALDACIEAARHARRLDALAALAARATADQPDWARGWRRLAEARLGQGDAEGSLAAASRWWEMTRSAEAVALWLDAASLVDNAVSAEQIGWLEAAARQTTDLGWGPLARVVDVLGDAGRAEVALEIVDGRAGALEQIEVRSAYCRVAAEAARVHPACGR